MPRSWHGRGRTACAWSPAWTRAWGPAKQLHGLLWRGVLELLRAGFPVAQALATATSVAADDCGLGEVSGRLRRGLAADLLVVDGDLRTDPDALGRPSSVLVRGTEAPTLRRPDPCRTGR